MYKAYYTNNRYKRSLSVPEEAYRDVVHEEKDSDETDDYENKRTNRRKKHWCDGLFNGIILIYCATATCLNVIRIYSLLTQ